MFVGCPVKPCLADCLTKTMDSSVLRECLRTGRYSLFDEDQVLKQRADGRQRLKWIREQDQQAKQKTEILEGTAKDESNLAVSFSVTEPQDFWRSGPGNQVRRIHVQPRINRFVPIGVTGCPVDIRGLSASRETRVMDGRSFRDFWTGTRGAAPLDTVWTGETVFFKQENKRE